MATLNFLYRSTKKEANLNLRLLYRYNGKDFVIGSKSKILVSKDYWDKKHNLKRIKDVDLLNEQSRVNKEIYNLQEYVLQRFEKEIKIGEIDKKWLELVLESYYNPETPISTLPTNLVGFIEVYIEDYRIEKGENVKKASITKFNVIKNKLIRFEEFLGRRLLIEDINKSIIPKFVEFYKSESYSQSTAQRELGIIKSFCYHARERGLKVSNELDKLRLEKGQTFKIYLTSAEIEQIANVELSADFLDNARDWLIISCYCGQRVSDFLRFSKEMIRVEDGKHLIEFKQKKTGKLMTIPLHGKILQVLDKRQGEFPRRISDQRYNDYIKEVCFKAGIDQITKGKIQTNISKDPKKSIIRSVVGNYKKYQLVTSHIGRRSFATNFYGKIPTSYLIYITGHSTEEMFLQYIGKSNKDLALEIGNYF